MNSLSLNSPLEELSSNKKKSKTITSLNNAGINNLRDLLWVLPLRAIKVPSVESFKTIQEGQFFRGKGKIINIRKTPCFQKGKRGIRLSNITAIVKDSMSSETILLQWFNAYPNMSQKIDSLDYEFTFLGKIGFYRNQFQMIAPDILDDESGTEGFKVQYPTVSGVASHLTKKLIDKIPTYIFEQFNEPLQELELHKRSLISLSNAFKVFHLRDISTNQYNENLLEKARRRLVYYEFHLEQLKSRIRKEKLKTKTAHRFNVLPDELNRYKSLFPYELTLDQENVLNEIISDFSLGHPMSRLIQGDVGCGKTTVALIASTIVANDGKQSAIMCPTESLAQQHYITFNNILKNADTRVGLLIGAHTAKEKREIIEDLRSGRIDIIVGTHALFQEAVEFKNLSLAIIDEQHKFGVNQRLKLISKGEGCHTLIMTATPIPRSLSLTQYGDLDISVIKTMPKNRAGIKTRIVSPETFEKFLSFIKTRLEMGEQCYIVSPAIEDNPEMDYQAVEKIYLEFSKIFKDFKVSFLHGKMSSDEKNSVLTDFTQNEVQLLVSTSVIEVGINILNATVMAIINPERFGLSSLHQLRGRVGRGEKPGFCFLVVDKSHLASLPRLKVIESCLDGFKISEADLKLRGEGDLFGVNQSGGVQRRIANIIDDQDILYMVKDDLESLLVEGDFKNELAHLEHLQTVVSTI